MIHKNSKLEFIKSNPCNPGHISGRHARPRPSRGENWSMVAALPTARLATGYRTLLTTLNKSDLGFDLTKLFFLHQLNEYLILSHNIRKTEFLKINPNITNHP